MPAGRRETFVIITGGIDLSVGFVMGFAGVSSAIVMRDRFAAGRPEAACLLVGAVIGLALGVLPGLLNGLLIARLRVPPFIATLGTYGVANGLALYLSNGFPITFLPQAEKIGNSFLAYFLPGRGLSFLHCPEGLEASTAQPYRDRARHGAGHGECPGFAFILTHPLRPAHLRHRREQGRRRARRDQRALPPAAHLHPVLAVRRAGGVLYVFRTGIGNFTTMNASYELFASRGGDRGRASPRAAKAAWGVP
jgi:hypothetical protein